MGILVECPKCKVRGSVKRNDSVCRLANEGLANWEICKELEIHKSTVSRYVKRGKEEGIIKPQNS